MYYGVTQTRHGLWHGRTMPMEHQNLGYGAANDYVRFRNFERMIQTDVIT